MADFSAALNVRTTLDQAGQLAGLAGELDVTESVIVRLLLAQALSDAHVLHKLKRQLLEQQLESMRDELERRELEQQLERLAEYAHEAGL